ncbi:hypothetical protein C7E12_23200, partial [Stenotrophomonas maltophilia]
MAGGPVNVMVPVWFFLRRAVISIGGRIPFRRKGLPPEVAGGPVNVMVPVWFFLRRAVISIGGRIPFR